MLFPVYWKIAIVCHKVVTVNVQILGHELGMAPPEEDTAELSIIISGPGVVGEAKSYCHRHVACLLSSSGYVKGYSLMPFGS